MKKYVLNISLDNRMIECILPGEDNRKGCLELYARTGITDMKISYEVWDGIWHLLTNESVRISKDHMIQKDVVIEEGMLLHGKIIGSGIHFSIMVNVLDEYAAMYGKYDIRRMQEIKVGGNNGCDIVLKDSFVSGVHTIMYRQDKGWYIKDQSKNGTYVNGVKIIGATRLHVSDTIYISGFRLIYLGNILAINQSGKRFVRMSEANRKELEAKNVHEDVSGFSRTPRQIEPLDEEEIEIEAPPSPVRKNKTPLLFILGPSLTMPVPILTMVLFNIMVNSNGGSPLAYMGMAISVIMFAVIGVFWTVMRNKHDKRSAEEMEIKRQQAFQIYIRRNEELIVSRQIKNRDILENMYRRTDLLAIELLNNRFALWNRNVNHEDFLHIRVGEGCMENPNPIIVPKKRFAVDADPLAVLPGKVYEKYRYLAPAAKTIHLKEHKLIGVVGGKKDINQVANSLIVQLAALHSYTDVKLVFLTDNSEEELNLKWAKWLPHVFSEDKKIRFFADSEQTVQNVLYIITSILRERKEAVEESYQKRKYAGHYVVFTTSREICERGTIYKYMTDDNDYGFTFVLLHGKMDALPNECKCVIEISGGFQGMYMLNEARTFANQVKFDQIDASLAERFARGISGIYIHELSEGVVPDSIDYFKLMGIGKIEQWDLLKHYKENRSFEGIRSVIGVSANEKPVVLDIHEKKYGPHGLIAGTTGSGKSETIQTFVLSLSLNYHPDEVAFILIDYKGGGMANAFLGLPHLAGTITNLGEENDGSEGIDDNQTRRALISIRSEIKRRQSIFNRYKVNHIDLYMRLYRNGKARESMPHLIIICDEFAELKKEQPEFIRELVSTARVGRSLGIHLILATQKPGGVVDDEIWSNSRFKICLRVQDKQDSIGMLKRPEAAALTITGRAYLQIGNDEIFEVFQSGYSGAPYEPKEEAKEMSGDEVSMIDIDGSEVVLRPKSKMSGDDTPSQLEVCVDYIREKAKEYHIKSAMPLWLPRLSGDIDLMALRETYKVDYKKGLCAVLGLVDYPEQQKQYPLVIDFIKTANLVIAGLAGCGKTTLVKTMVVSLAIQYSPLEVQFYCMDFSSRTLKNFEKLPHVGSVIFSEEEEKVFRLMGLLENMMETRKDMLFKKGVGSFQEYIKVENSLPLIVLIIDNYFEFSQCYIGLEERFQKITRDGIKYGINTVVTVNRPGDMRYKLRQNFERVLPVKLADKGEYLEVFGCSPESLPPNMPGRGLVLEDGVLEYQAALPVPGETDKERTSFLNGLIEERAEKYQEIKACSVPVLPADENYQVFYERYSSLVKDKGVLPLGYDKNSLEIWGLDLKKDYCVCISSGKPQGISNIFSNIIYGAQKLGFQIDCISQGMPDDYGLPMDEDKAYKRYLYKGYDQVRELLIELKKEFKARKQGADYSNSIRLVFIPDMKAFSELIYSAQNEEAMYPLVEVFFREGRERGILFIGGFQVQSQTSYLYMQACKNFTDYRRVWHVGGPLNQQRVAEYAIPVGAQMKDNPLNEGYVLEGEVVKEIFVPKYKGIKQR